MKPRKPAIVSRRESAAGAPGRGRPVRRSARWRRLVWLGTLLLTPAPGTGAAAPADTLGLRFEVGAASDLTNELFYEDAFIDTTFLGRRQVSSPETRVAGVLFATLDGTRRDRAARFSLQNELRLGDKLQRNALQLTWNDDFSPDWRLSLNPRLEYRNDRTFDRDLEEWRGSASGRLRRAFDDGNMFADLRAKGEFLRTHGTGADFIPDRNAFQLGASLDRAPLFGNEWRLGYRIDARQFPDSSVRDHFEHGFDGRIRFSHAAGHWFSLDGTLSRRVTMRVAPTSRDNFWQEWAQAELGLRLAEEWQARARMDFEGFQYEVQDTSIYFNYAVARARLGPRYDRLTGLGVTAGPQAEILRSAVNPAEDYDEFGGFFEIEFFGLGGWWSATPAAGWRDYSGTSLDPGGLDLHDSYAFYELSVLGDQRLPAALRLRALGTVRLERHADSASDATSLYFSLDVRRLF
jgi:hypothetical protein